MVEVYAIKLLQDTDFEHHKKEMQKYFPEQSLQKILQKSAYGSQSSMLGEVIVRKRVADKFKINSANIELKHTEHGKPYIDLFPDFHFNISHSKEWVIVAFSNKEVGIDIEKIKPIKLTVAERFFSHQEYMDLINKNESKQINYFFDLWTAKESFVKAIGSGIANVFNTFSIQIQNEHIKIAETHFPDVKFKTYKLPYEYKICVCAFESEFCGNVNILNIVDLI